MCQWQKNCIFGVRQRVPLICAVQWLVGCVVDEVWLRSDRRALGGSANNRASMINRVRQSSPLTPHSPLACYYDATIIARPYSPPAHGRVQYCDTFLRATPTVNDRHHLLALDSSAAIALVPKTEQPTKTSLYNPTTLLPPLNPRHYGEPIKCASQAGPAAPFQRMRQNQRV